MSSTGTTVNPYRFGAAWGYMTDTASSTQGSGLLQLGARYYWPEIGRFIQQDPTGDGMNWYAYAGNNPVVWVDPEGFHETASLLHNIFHGDGQSLGLAGEGLAAGADGFIPFWDPFRGSYNSCDPYLQASQAMGGVTRDAMLSAGLAEAGLWEAASGRLASARAAYNARGIAGAVRALTKGKIGLDLGRASHPVGKRLLMKSGVPGKLAKALTRKGEAIPHINIGKTHVIVNYANWWKPWKWFVK